MAKKEPSTKRSAETKPASSPAASEKSASSDVVTQGMTVHLHYTGKLDDSTTFDSSEGKEPLEFVAGSGMVIEGFDNAVMGMRKGEKKSFVIPSDKAYGPRREEMQVTLPKQTIAQHDQLEKGRTIMLSMGGRQFMAKIEDITPTEVMLDMNHPLAGKDLHFDITITDITTTTKKEGCCSEDCHCGHGKSEDVHDHDDTCNCSQEHNDK